MQKRDFSPKSLIVLPRLSAAQTVILITMVIAAAETFVQKSGPLPLSIERPRKRLVTALAALGALVSPDSDADSPVAVAIDRRLDRAWSALMDFLSAWQKIPSSKHPNPERGAHLFDLLFAKGLAFTKIRFRLQWQESQARLEAVDRENHEATIVQLGGKVFLDEVREAHAAYGKVLGVTEPAPEEDVKIRTLMEAAQDMLRDYLAKVEAYADPEEPGSAELAEALAEPVRSWESLSAKKAKEDADPPATPAPGGQATP